MLATTRRQQYADSVNKLKRFINGTTAEDFASIVLGGSDLADANTEVSAISNEIQQLRAIISPVIDVINGGYFVHELLEKFTSILSGAEGPAANLLAGSIRITPNNSVVPNGNRILGIGVLNSIASSNISPSDSLKPYHVNEIVKRPEDLGSGNLDAPKKEDTTINVIEILNSRIGSAIRDTMGLSVFASVVPAHIISRAVPFVAVRIYGVNDNTTTNDGSKAGGLNILRYLKGSYTLNDTNQFDSTILGFQQGILRPTSMEVFTAPQTMVSDIQSFEANKTMLPVDRFRPLMTLNSITFDVASSGAGFISFKTGKINLTLHDRGRLSEVATFVKANLYSETEIEIEYGWSIDTSSGRLATALEVDNGIAKPNQRVFGGRLQDDALAQFVDSLRVTEKYIIVNSNFSFDDAGQVNIGLDLAMKGSKDIESYEVTGLEKNQKQILKKLIEDIGKIVNDQGATRSVLSETFLGAVSSEDNFFALDEKALKDIQAEINKLKGSGSTSLSSLSTAADELFVEITSRQGVSAASVDKMFDRMKKGFERFPASEDVLKDPSIADTQGAGLNAIGLSAGEYAEGSTSLGVAMLTFIGHPLAASKKFDEIQFIFNKFNDRAGFMRSLSIASFPLDTAKLKDAIKKLYTKRPNVSVRQVIDLVGSFVESINHPAYGFSGAYDKDGKIKADTGLTVTETQLKKAGILDTNFQQPKLTVYTECVPHHEYREKTILRIIVSDSQASPFQEHSEAITSGRSDVARFVDLGAIDPTHPLFRATFTKDLDPKSEISKRKSILQKMSAADGPLKPAFETPGAVRKSADDVFYSIDLTNLLRSNDSVKMKNFLQRGLPVIRYGNMGGLVKSISVSSINDARLNTVNILRADSATGGSSAAPAESGLPLLVNGTEVQVEMMGCPILNFGQSFYIDTGTGTSIDNIYVCTGLSHKLSPGEFTTSAKFTLNVGAYGIYSSSKREFAVMAAIARALSLRQPGGGTPEKPSPGPLSIFGGLELTRMIPSNIIAKTLLESGGSVLRFWFDESDSHVDVSKFRGIKTLNGDNSIQINTFPSIKGVFQLLPNKGVGYHCYEIAMPDRNTNGSEIDGTLHVQTVEKIEKISVKVDLQDLPVLLKAAIDAGVVKKTKAPKKASAATTPLPVLPPGSLRLPDEDLGESEA